MDEFLAKLVRMENLYHDENLPLTQSEQIDSHPQGLQKRGRRK